MSELEASASPVVIDAGATPPQTTGTTDIHYRKFDGEELWEIPAGEPGPR